ncbi:MAG: 2-keto-4-pentenoate hydratase [Alphaproteobacteria bacterium]
MKLSAAALEQAANLLIAARGDMRKLAAFPPTCAPHNEADAYAIQDAFGAATGWPVAGWKIGCTSEEAQKMLSAPGPFFGRVFAHTLIRMPGKGTPAEAEHRAFLDPGVESEFAFVMARDLPPRDKPYSRDEVGAAVASLHPAFEIVDPRWLDWLKVGLASIVADNGANGGLLLGPAVANWRAIDLAAVKVSLTFDGKHVMSGEGSAVMGHPLNALTWLANELPKRGHFLRAGEAVTTGTCTSLHKIPPNIAARADFGPVGAAQLVFTR